MALVLGLLEGSVLSVALLGATLHWATPLLLDWLDVVVLLAQIGVVAFCCIAAFYYNDLYDLRVVRSFGDFAPRLVQAFGVTFILLAVFYYLAPQARLAEDAFVSAFLLIGGLILPIRGASYAFLRSRPFSHRTLILGTSPLAEQIVAEMDRRPELLYTVVGVVDTVSHTGDTLLSHPVLGPLERLDKIVDQVRPDRIVVGLAERRGRLPVSALLAARAQGIVVEEGVDVFERFTGKLAIEFLTPRTLIFSPVFGARRSAALCRIISFACSAAGLVLAAPLMALIALAIKCDSPGPVFFVQERAGFQGRPFRLTKFRTMREAPAGSSTSVWNRDDSDRITRVGRWLRKFRVDELPQFWNILRGDMNLIGPRPEMMQNVSAMTEQIPYYALRHTVRPGVTGWAQVRHGYSVDLEDVTEKMRYDLYYIKHMSLWFDLRILIDTVKIILFGRGAR